jgi:rhomboid protease GluP
MITMGYSSGRKISMTYILLAINIAVYIVESILSGNPFFQSDKVLMIMGKYNALVFEGWWWQLFTSMFVHVTIAHITFNMFFLWILGVQYERIFGGKSLLFLYILSGLAGNLLSLFLYPWWYVTAGASGSIFGIFGAIILFNARITGNIRFYILYGFIIFIFNSMFANVDIFGHLGGLLSGMVVGNYYGKKFLSYFGREVVSYA